MIPIFQYLYVALLLLFPLGVATYFSFNPSGAIGPSRLSVWPRVSIIYLFLFLLAGVGLFYFSQHQGLEFYFEMGPLAREFEVSIVLSEGRFVWVACFVLVAFFQVVVFLDDYFVKNGGNQSARRLVLFGLFSLSSILALLSGRALLAILFLELSVFLLHLLKADYDAPERASDYVSFFKRCLFVVLGLVVMAVLSAGNVFSDDAIFIAGFMLYLMSLIYNNHAFASWNKSSWFSYLLLFTLFIFWRFYQAGAGGAAPEFAAVVFVFAMLSAMFAFFGTISPRKLNCFYWYCVSLASLKFFILFSSSAIERGAWAQEGLVLVMALLIMAALLRGLDSVLSPIWRGAGIFSLGVLHLLVMGLLPGVGWFQLQRLDGGGISYLASYLVCAFFLGTNIGRLLDYRIHASSAPRVPDMPTVIYRAQIALTLVLVGLAQYFSHILSGVSFVAWDSLIEFAQQKRAIFGAAGAIAGFGMLLGTFAQSYKAFSAFLSKREKKMEGSAPRVDPIMNGLNNAFASGPEKIIEAARKWFSDTVSAASDKLQALNDVYEVRIWSGPSGLVRSFSLLIRYLHGGSAQIYIFGGILVLCFGILFLYILP